MLVMFVPMTAILVQLVANYARDPIPVGAIDLVTARLDPAVTQEKPTAVRLELPDGVVLDAPPVRTADGEIVWRVKALAAGDHVLKIHVGDRLIEKRLAVGGGPRKVPVMRTKSWEALLYPAEAGMPADSPLYSVDLTLPGAAARLLPGRRRRDPRLVLRRLPGRGLRPEGPLRRHPLGDRSGERSTWRASSAISSGGGSTASR